MVRVVYITYTDLKGIPTAVKLLKFSIVPAEEIKREAPPWHYWKWS
jgi:hypothetical protein